MCARSLSFSLETHSWRVGLHTLLYGSTIFHLVKVGCVLLLALLSYFFDKSVLLLMVKAEATLTGAVWAVMDPDVSARIIVGTGRPMKYPIGYSPRHFDSVKLYGNGAL